MAQQPFVHLELSTPDLAKAKAFYTQLFGWKIDDMDMGGGMTYSTFKPDTAPGGGMVSMPGAPTGWLPYVGVEDIHASTEHARALGATVVTDVTEIPNVGWMSVLTDPTGAAIALFRPM